MVKLDFETQIDAPIERCFDLSRDIGFHTACFSDSAEQAIAGRTTGLIELSETVTWRGKHFGLWHTHQSLITEMDRPHHFCDEMLAGRFKSFRHTHHYRRHGSATIMRDVLEFSAPFGVLGLIAERLFLASYMERLLRRRAEGIKAAAET